MTTLSSTKLSFLSHEGRELQDHLEQTLQHAKTLIGDTFIFKDVSQALLEGIDFRDVVKIIAAMHDFGKATRFFQEMLRESIENRPTRRDPLTRHSEISALLALAAIHLYLDRKTNNLPLSLCHLLVFVVIARHHGKLDVDASRGFLEIVPSFKQKTYLLQQFEDLRVHAFEYLKNAYGVLTREVPRLKDIDFSRVFDLAGKLVSFLVEGTDDGTLKRTFNDISMQIRLTLKKPKSEAGWRSRFGQYFTFKIAFSILLESDKLNAAFGPDSASLEHPYDVPPTVELPALVRQFKLTNFTKHDAMQELREKLSNEVSTSISHADLVAGSRIFTLNAPTGSGKTLTSLSSVTTLAARLREFNQGENRFPRFIYCLPFLSIIDQVENQLERLFEQRDPGGIIPSSLLIAHHHLTEMTYTPAKRSNHVDDKGDYQGIDADLLISAWNSEFVVTTFHQLANAMFSSGNKDNLKFNKIHQSIIIMDEIQSFPLRYWKLVRFAFLQMSRLFGTPFFLMSATLPAIFDPNEVVTLLRDPGKDYFSQLDRIAIHVDVENAMTVKAFAERLFLTFQQGKSYLVVVNTRRCARDLSQRIKELVQSAGETDSYQLEFLSSDVLVADRRETLSRVRESIKKKTPESPIIVLVSTQVIEAGVDIDFDIVYRDLAPLDSLIQVAGRCNRNFDPSRRGTFTIVRLIDDHSGTGKAEAEFSGQVYDPELIALTNRALAASGAIADRDKGMTEGIWHDLSIKYYESIQAYFTTFPSDNILEYLAKLDFASIDEQFYMIEDALTINVFLSKDERTEGIWAAYLSLGTERDFIARKNKFLTLKKDFEERVLSVRLSKRNREQIDRLVMGKQIIMHSEDLLYVSPAHFPSFYDEKGFELPES